MKKLSDFYVYNILIYNLFAILGVLLAFLIIYIWAYPFKILDINISEHPIPFIITIYSYWPYYLGLFHAIPFYFLIKYAPKSITYLFSIFISSFIFVTIVHPINSEPLAFSLRITFVYIIEKLIINLISRLKTIFC